MITGPRVSSVLAAHRTVSRPFGAHSPLRGRKSAADEIQVGEREQREHLGAILGDSAIAHMVPRTPLSVVPDVVITPLLGFSGLCRLGYGGGYFDRTLAALHSKPWAIGIGAECGRMQGFIPQSHDIPMDVIVTEAGIYRRASMAEGNHEHR